MKGPAEARRWYTALVRRRSTVTADPLQRVHSILCAYALPSDVFPGIAHIPVDNRFAQEDNAIDSYRDSSYLKERE